MPIGPTSTTTLTENLHFRLLAPLVLAAVLSASGANWYVDAAAAGAANGTSWTDAWPDPTNVVWGVSGVTAGDTLYISGGASSQTYTNPWKILASGTAESPITIRVGQDAGKNGSVIFDGDRYGSTCTSNFVSASGYNNITWNGEVSGAKRFVFRNIYNVTNRENIAGCIRASTVTNTSVRFVVFTNVNTGIHFQTVSNVSISYCDFYVRGDAAIRLWGTSGTTWDQNSVYSNNITLMWDGEGGPDGIQGPLTGVTIRGNRFGVMKTTEFTHIGQHPDYIQSAGSQKPPRWLRITQNDFLNIADSAIDCDPDSPTAAIEDIEIINNVFRITEADDLYPNYIRLYNNNSESPYPTYYQNVHIINNLFADNTSNNTTVVSFTSELGDNPGTNNLLANNIFVNCGGVNNYIWRVRPTRGTGQSEWTITNNIMYPSTGSSIVTWLANDYTVKQWKETFDPSTQTNLPTFRSYDFASAANNFRLSGSDEVALNKGINYSSIFTTDFDGNTRGGAWDIGPFEYVGGGGRLQNATIKSAIFR